MTFDDIKNTIAPQWKAFLSYQDALLQSDVTLVNTINDYLSVHGGKHLRPLLVLLAAGVSNNNNPQIPQLATVVELLHNASLMHDDVVDNDAIRRNAPSIQQKWNIRVALLTGDYYLARMIQVLNEINNSTITQTVVATATAMAEGELLQQQLLLNGGNCDTDAYLRIIEHKTAHLMQTSCVLGANQNNDAVKNHLQQFGYNYGMAFQIHDDINDSKDEKLPWIPERKTLERLLQQYCQQANNALLTLPSTTHQNALIQITNNLKS